MSATGPAILAPSHRRMLEVESAIPADILAEEGVYSLRAGDPLPTPDPAFRHPNSWKGQRFPTWPREISRTGAIVFPHRDAHGRENPILRPDTPRLATRDDGTTRPVKYEQCGGARLSFYVPKRVAPLLGDVTIPIRFTEGDKKTLAAVGRGFPTIGLSGVDCWKVQAQPKTRAPSEPLPDLDDIALRGRIALLELDSDTASNPNVRGARRRFGDELRRRGAAVVDVDIPPGPNGEKQGLDDFLANGGDLAALENAAIVAAILAPKRTEPPITGGDGEETCLGCRERKRTDAFLKRGPFRPNIARAHLAFAGEARRLVATGRRRETLDCADVAARNGLSSGELSRAVGAYVAIQDDPERAPGARYRLIPWKDAHHRNRLDLELLDGTGAWTVAELATTMTSWRPEAPPRPTPATPTRTRSLCDCGGILQSTQKVCRSCTKVHHFPVPYIPATPVAPEEPPIAQRATAPIPVPLPSPITCATRNGSGHDPSPDEPPIPRMTVTFVSLEDMEAASGPRYWGEAPPEAPPPPPDPKPLPLAPPHHRAWTFKPPPPAAPPAVAGGET